MPVLAGPSPGGPSATGLRHFSRHLHATVQDQIKAHLQACGWLPPTVPNPAFVTLFGAQPVTFQRQRPEESLLQSIKANLVTVSFGGQGNDQDEQLGGGMVSQEHVFFVDVYAENDAVAVALAEDVRDLLAGRTAAGRFFRVQDHTALPTTPVLGYLGEYDEVFREPAARELANVRWQIVRATAYVTMPGEA